MFTFILFGTGWRACYFTRIAKALPQDFSIPAIYTRNSDRLSFIQSLGFNGTTDMDKALSYPHGEVIIASGPKDLAQTLEYLQNKGETIITETSFLSLSDQETTRCNAIEGYVLEQYPYTPLFSAALSLLPLIGKVHEFRLSMLHNHHAAAMMRKVFPNYKDFNIESVDFESNITKTDSREGTCTTGEAQNYTRKMRILKGDDWLFINDFSTNQYHTHLIPSNFEIRGEKGVITNTGIAYTNEEGLVIKEQLKLNNPYPNTSLNDDEIAIVYILNQIIQGKYTYTIQEAIKDALLGRKL